MLEIMEDILLQTCTYLKADELICYSLTCKNYNASLSKDILWKPLFLREFSHPAFNNLPSTIVDWKSYYRHIFLKIVWLHSKANVYDVTSCFECDYDTEDEWITQIDTLKPFCKDIKAGDIVHLSNLGDYRNDGKYIYDGTNIIPLDYEDMIDCDHGHVPIKFKVPQDFPPQYWSDCIEHNLYIPFHSKDFVDQLVNNIQFEEKAWKTFFFHDHIKYNVLIYWDEQEPDRNNLADAINKCIPECADSIHGTEVSIGTIYLVYR